MLGVQSVPDGLATGLRAGVNPLAGLYGYMVGTISGALTTSSTFMAIQGTGAMAMLMADVAVLRESSNPAQHHPVPSRVPSAGTATAVPVDGDRPA